MSTGTDKLKPNNQVSKVFEGEDGGSYRIDVAVAVSRLENKSRGVWRSILIAILVGAIGLVFAYIKSKYF